MTKPHIQYSRSAKMWFCIDDSCWASGYTPDRAYLKWLEAKQLVKGVKR